MKRSEIKAAQKQEILGIIKLSMGAFITTAMIQQQMTQPVHQSWIRSLLRELMREGKLKRIGIAIHPRGSAYEVIDEPQG